ncbi:hypothetical protein [Mycoplasma sp. OR1901]|uniref:hypothetical protein n=1 Tax=Mycoplasma sp. OR1901 TaxID=2742195 RepID=UPI001581A0A4|nr:hypothetical protein [Mycoplasma sp. OR1901]QKT05725.1 hypothetical protein HTZ87_03420 [Mycoplasma sp. OR1901]
MKKIKFILGSTVVVPMIAGLSTVVSCGSPAQPKEVDDKSKEQQKTENSEENKKALETEISTQSKNIVNDVEKSVNNVLTVFKSEIQAVNVVEDSEEYLLPENSKLLKVISHQNTENKWVISSVQYNMFKHILDNDIVSNIIKNVEVKGKLTEISKYVLEIFSEVSKSFGLTYKETKDVIGDEILPLIKSILDVDKILSIYTEFSTFNKDEEKIKELEAKIFENWINKDAINNIIKTYITGFIRKETIANIIKEKELKVANVKSSLEKLFAIDSIFAILSKNNSNESNSNPVIEKLNSAEFNNMPEELKTMIQETLIKTFEEINSNVNSKILHITASFNELQVLIFKMMSSIEE